MRSGCYWLGLHGKWMIGKACQNILLILMKIQKKVASSKQYYLFVMEAFDEAEKYINKTREYLDSTISPLVLESYNRVYKQVVIPTTT